MRCVEVELPGGMRFEDGWRRDAALRPLSGDDEVSLLEEGRALPMAARATAVLQRCITRVGSLGPVTPDHVRRLSVGDREALLLHLRRLTLGDNVEFFEKTLAEIVTRNNQSAGAGAMSSGH